MMEISICAKYAASAYGLAGNLRKIMDARDES